MMFKLTRRATATLLAVGVSGAGLIAVYSVASDNPAAAGFAAPTSAERPARPVSDLPDCTPESRKQSMCLDFRTAPEGMRYCTEAEMYGGRGDDAVSQSTWEARSGAEPPQLDCWVGWVTVDGRWAKEGPPQTVTLPTPVAVDR